MEKANPEFNKRILEERLAQKLSLRDLEERTGLSYPFINYLERGQRILAQKNWLKFARALWLHPITGKRLRDICIYSKPVWDWYSRKVIPVSIQNEQVVPNDLVDWIDAIEKNILDDYWESLSNNQSNFVLKKNEKNEYILYFRESSGNNLLEGIA